MNPRFPELFSDADLLQNARTEQIGEQSFVLRGFALPRTEPLLSALDDVLRQAPLRRMTTPGGFLMSVTSSSCGTFGWTTDRSGYRYTREDPDSGRPWPVMPTQFEQLAVSAAREARFDGFAPDSCLINRYTPGAKMSLHQDKDERLYSAPIVSLSLGLPAVFLFGGHRRSDKTQRISLFHGDMVVWGGVDRLRHHGILPLPEGQHPRLGEQRFNLTFRVAG